MAAKITMRPQDLTEGYIKDPRYRDYMLDKAREINRAATSIFLMVSRLDNEWRLSVTTPPKYISSFKVEIDLSIQTSFAINFDPAWNMVEYGAHPGGDDAFVLGYKPLTRGLELVASLHQQ